jgi:hypothetical protein
MQVITKYADTPKREVIECADMATALFVSRCLRLMAWATKMEYTFIRI